MQSLFSASRISPTTWRPPLLPAIRTQRRLADPPNPHEHTPHEARPLGEAFVRVPCSHLEDVLQKQRPDRVTLYGLDDQALFYQHMNGPLIPTLRLVHRFPSAFRTIQIDRGAIRFVLSGATLMVPGLTSPGGRLPPSPSSEKQDKPQRRKGENDDDDDEAEATDAPLAAGAVVVVMAEGKQEACMVGELKMGTEEMKKVGKGVAIDNGHFLGDGLWRIRID